MPTQPSKDLETFDKLRFILNRRIEPVLAPRDAILEAINRHYGQSVGESADSMLQEFTDTAIDFTETEEGSQAADEEIDESAAPIVRLVHLLITEAVQLRASDIHIEPFEERIRVRYRIDGVLVERDSPPRRLLGALMSRVKILSKQQDVRGCLWLGELLAQWAGVEFHTIQDAGTAEASPVPREPGGPG